MENRNQTDRTCVSCQTLNGLGAQFCHFCGTTLPDREAPAAPAVAKHCTACGAVVHPNWACCEACGAAVGRDNEPGRFAQGWPSGSLAQSSGLAAPSQPPRAAPSPLGPHPAQRRPADATVLLGIVVVGAIAAGLIVIFWVVWPADLRVSSPPTISQPGGGASAPTSKAPGGGASAPTSPTPGAGNAAGPSQDELRAAINSYYAAGLKDDGTPVYYGMTISSGARNVQLQTNEIVRVGVWNEREQYIAVQSRVAGTFETAFSAFDVNTGVRKVWTPCRFTGTREYRVRRNDYGEWSVERSWRTPFDGLKLELVR